MSVHSTEALPAGRRARGPVATISAAFHATRQQDDCHAGHTAGCCFSLNSTVSLDPVGGPGPAFVRRRASAAVPAAASLARVARLGPDCWIRSRGAASGASVVLMRALHVARRRHLVQRGEGCRFARAPSWNVGLIARLGFARMLAAGQHGCPWFVPPRALDPRNRSHPASPAPGRFEGTVESWNSSGFCWASCT